MSALHFAWPWAFALLPLPLLVAWLLPRARGGRLAALRIPFYAELQRQLVLPETQRRRWPVWLAALGWLFLVASAARPQWIGEPLQLPVSGRDLMMAVDLSGSMQERDMRIQNRLVDRLTAVKVVAGEFIERRKGDRIGLILFGDRAYLQAPLTFDRKTVHKLLNEAVIGLAGEKTAIGDAIGLAVKRLRDSPRSNRVLILLTDGENTAGSVDPLKAADLAAQEHIRVYTIGIGGQRMVRGVLGLSVLGNSGLDEDSLRAIASKTGGRYFRARDLKDLSGIYAELDKLEPTSQQDKTYRPVAERFRWPLSMALLISVLLALGMNRIGRHVDAG